MKVRLSAELRRKVEEAARLNNRTLNAEIVSRLEWGFATGGMSLHRPQTSSNDESLRDEVVELKSQLRALRKDVAEIGRRTQHMLPRVKK
ncbi:Arc family DNA-binding protein [Mesorhizobium sp. WSM3626]|uniref:Arc family DNA-binding protein n=1 Tax=Mesorhizobium sp. WSM3626 TaxID=1040987 RepID=UPI001FD99FFF|nr:Arc family DNA-binding protein [Mesorhizobium sp. WSM3626]